MEMEFMAESVAGTSGDRGHQINRRKRTDRCRPCSPLGVAETTSTSSSGGGESSSTGNGACMINYYTTDQSQTLSSEEEEDMANCLIMLAQSVSPAKEDKSDLRWQKTEKFKSRRLTEIAPTDGGKSCFLIYECKTCNRAFPSFQALGGHRASHKKPKPAVEERNSISMELSEEDRPQLVGLYKENRFTTNNKSPSPPPGFIQTGYNNNKGKIHECSICGSEFLSGQALGGHMRRHRIAPPSSNQISISTNTDDRFANHIIKKSPMLSLDLNLPAPEVADDVHSNFQFTASSPPPQLVFSAPALVDCHY